MEAKRARFPIAATPAWVAAILAVEAEARGAAVAAAVTAADRER